MRTFKAVIGVTPKMIAKKIKKMKVTNHLELMGYHQICLRKLLSKLVHHLQNLSLEEGIVPSESFLIKIYLAYKKVIYQCSIGFSETSWESNLRVETMWY